MKERTTNMNLIIEIRTVYGNRYVYPICKKAIALCQITNQKTFSQFAINKLKEIGYTFTQKEVSL
jgi:hypothetical protein